MAINLSDVMKMTPEEVHRAFTSTNPKTCCECKKSLFQVNYQVVPAGFMCNDCYFEGLGNLVEQHPICNPERIHGKK